MSDTHHTSTAAPRQGAAGTATAPASRRYRLAALTTHPIQYQAPLFRELARQPEIELRVYFGSDDHYATAALDKDFGVPVAWDRPLLDGYDSRFLSRCSRLPRALARVAASARLVRELARERYDAILVTSYNDVTSLTAYLGAWATGTPVLLRTESELLKSRPAWIRLAKRLLLAPLFRRTAAFLAIGTANRGFLRHYGVADRATFDVPYCVDNDFFLAARERLPHKSELKRELGLDPDLPVIVFSGKLIDRKRPLDLVAAFARLEAAGAGLLLIGDGPLRGEIERTIAAQRLRNIRITGFKNQTELPRCYGAGDIFVLPSAFETWGLVVNEGMLFGMPALATDMAGCAQDLIEDGATGYVYPAGDIARLTARLQELVRDAARREAMGKQAEQRVRKLSYAACTRGILQALEAGARKPASHARGGKSL